MEQEHEAAEASRRQALDRLPMEALDRIRELEGRAEAYRLAFETLLPHSTRSHRLAVRAVVEDWRGDAVEAAHEQDQYPLGLDRVSQLVDAARDEVVGRLVARDRADP